jgi:hypothetical protein
MSASITVDTVSVMDLSKKSLMIQIRTTGRAAGVPHGYVLAAFAFDVVANHTPTPPTTRFAACGISFTYLASHTISPSPTAMSVVAIRSARRLNLVVEYGRNGSDATITQMDAGNQ